MRVEGPSDGGSRTRPGPEDMPIGRRLRTVPGVSVRGGARSPASGSSMSRGLSGGSITSSVNLAPVVLAVALVNLQGC